jgi:predicted dehydrogenase
MVREVELDGADCPTDTGSHHNAATMLLDLGLHTMCEKPLALTIRGCKKIIAAAERSGKILSIAENYRRDPINRLIRALLDDSAIGDRQFMLEAGIGGRDSMIITPWRHQKMSGTITLDAGVHNADILQYFFGDAERAYGQTRLYEKTRVKRATAGPGGFYQKWADNFPDTFEATGEDAIFGMINFANGTFAHWIDHHAGHGLPFRNRTIYGTEGSIVSPGDRNGNPARLILDDGTDVMDGRILEYAPSYRLSPIAASLFGGERVWTYSYDFPITDRKILALEYHEFAECIRTGAKPEVDGAVALRDVALVYALFESQIAGRPVTIEEIESSAVDAYQREIDEQLGLIPS